MEPKVGLAEIEIGKGAAGVSVQTAGIPRGAEPEHAERSSAWRPRQIARSLMTALIPQSKWIVRGSTRSNAVYLTFDDGPHPEYTPKVLDALKESGAKATFFLIGKNCLAHPELVRRIREEGHCIGHHSFTHSLPESTSAKALCEEVLKTDEALAVAGESRLRQFLRPPHGKTTASKSIGLWKLGRTIVLWNRDSKDYQRKSAEQIAQWEVNNPLVGGDIVLLHDVNPYTPEALPRIIESVRSRGLALKTIEDLAAPAVAETSSAAGSIVCFAKDWEECPTSNNHVMRELAKTHRVLWLNSIATRTPSLSSGRDLKKIIRKLRSFAAGPKRVAENMWVYTPLVLPLPHSKIAKKINERLLRLTVRRLTRKLKMQGFQLWSFLPNAASYAGKLGESLVVYYCVDDWAKFNYLDGERIAKEEKRLVENADIVFASANSLVADRRGWNKETHLARHGVDHELFSKAMDPGTPIPPDVDALPRPILGFYGTLQDWVDFRLIRYLAERHPEWSIALIGPALTDLSTLNDLANVHLLGRKAHSELPNYCKAFSVGIIPYVINERLLHVNPLKMREYLSAGLPVVSTPLPELEDYRRYCAIAGTHEEFEEAIQRALREDSPEIRRERSAAMSKETWEHAAARIVAQVRRVLDTKGKKQ
jgi:peptidoglycan/xylan/chitin deacetylase (PgdA/CDA1 family)